MRKTTLIAIFLGLVFLPTYFSKEFLALAGFPDLAREYRAIVGLIVVGFAWIVLTILWFMNRRILDWRKARGRDIEEEERYESDHGMISLTPKDKDLEN